MRHPALRSPWFALALALVTALALAGAAGPARAGVDFWTPIGPDGGNVDALAATPAQPYVLFAGSFGGGVFRSADGGATWVHASRGITDLGVTALAVDPRSPATVYAGTGSGVAKSVDSGATWKQPNPPSDPGWPTALAIDPQSSSIMYGASEDGLFLSLDGGSSWTRVQAVGYGQYPALAVDPARPGTVYIVRQFASTQVLRSTDHGATWTEKDAGLPLTQIFFGGAGLPGSGWFVQLAVDASTSPSTIYLAYLDNTAVKPHLYRSTDAGDSWQPSGPGGYPLALGQGVIYAGAFKSSDHGATWQPSTTPPQPAIALAAAPGSATTVYAGTRSKGVWKSGDAAAGWQTANAGLTATSPQALAIDPLHSEVLYAAVDDSVQGPGLLKSVDGGQDWQHVGPDWLPTFLPNNFQSGVLVVDPVTPTVLYAGTNYGLARSADGGVTWEIVGQPGGSACFAVGAVAIAPVPAETVYVAGQFFDSCACQFGGRCGCPAVKSTDGGNSWSCLALGLAEAFGIFVAPSAPSTVYAYGYYIHHRHTFNALFKSTDGGVTWARSDRGLPSAVVALAIDPTDANHVFASVGSAIFRTTNGGGTWSEYDHKLPKNASVTALAIDPQSPANVYAGGSFGVYHSSNGGRTWNPINGGLPNFARGLLLLDPQHSGKLYAGTGATGVYTYTVQ